MFAQWLSIKNIEFRASRSQPASITLARNEKSTKRHTQKANKPTRTATTAPANNQGEICIVRAQTCTASWRIHQRNMDHDDDRLFLADELSYKYEILRKNSKMCKSLAFGFVPTLVRSIDERLWFPRRSDASHRCFPFEIFRFDFSFFFFFRFSATSIFDFDFPKEI